MKKGEIESLKEEKEVNEDNKFKYKLVKKIGVISVNSQGWTKEVNLISYNGKKAVVDIRFWSPNRKMSRGITIKKEDLSRTIDLLKSIKKEFKENN